MEIQDLGTSLGMTKKGSLKGTVRIKILDKDKNVIEDKTVTNNIVKGIRIPIIKLLAGYNPSNEESSYVDDDGNSTYITTFTSRYKLPVISQLVLGSASSRETGEGVSVEDTDLFARIDGSENTTATKPTISADGLRATFSFLYSAEDSHIDYSTNSPTTIREMGLFTCDGQMVAHTVVGEWKKIAGVYLEVYWTIGYATTD